MEAVTTPSPGSNPAGPTNVLAAGTRLTAPDIAVVALYLVMTMGIALWAMFRHNQSSAKNYFLAGRTMNWILVGGSLFSSNIGSEHFIGLAGSGAATGLAVAGFEWNSAFTIFLLGWLFVPVYIAAGVYTIPEYLDKRFQSRRMRVYATAVALLLYILTKISVDVYAGALFIQQALDWNLFLSVGVLIIITGFFTLTGGLRAVMVMDTMQTVLMVIGALVLAIRSFAEVGGIDGLFEKYPQAIATLGNQTIVEKCGKPPSDALHMYRDPDSPNYPFPGFIGIVTASIWYWCTDQVTVQRCLAAESLSHAKGGCVVAMFLKIMPMFLIVMPGMISRVLNPDTVGCADPSLCQAVCESPAGCSNIAYPQLVMGLLPAGLRGLMLAVMVAAVMSSLTSIFNSSSTIFTMDVWRNIRKDASQKELMIVGRISVLVMVAIGVAWIPFVKGAQGAQLFIYIQSIGGCFTPAMAAIFVLAVLWTRTTEKGAFWGAMFGTAMGTVRLVLNFVYQKPRCPAEDTRPDVIKLHFMYFNFLLFVCVGVVIVIISLCTEPMPDENIARLTWWTQPSSHITSLEYLTGRSTENSPPDAPIEISMVKEVKAEPRLETADEPKVEPPRETETLGQRESYADKATEKNMLRGWFKKLWRSMLGQEETMATDRPTNQIALQQTRRDRIILNTAAATAIGAVVCLWIVFR